MKGTELRLAEMSIIAAKNFKAARYGCLDVLALAARRQRIREPRAAPIFYRRCYRSVTVL